MMAAGLVSLGGYLPAKQVPQAKGLAAFLRKETRLPEAYIQELERTGKLPGSIETNGQGWEKQPWFEAWLNRLSPKKRENPFQGTKERRRVPLDPTSLRESIHPHPMLASDAETLAGAIALFQSQIPKDAIDLVLVSSLVPDRHVPLNASLVQHKLGLKNAGAYNVDTCCSSFITMLEIASLYVRSGLKNHVLIVASSLDSIINDKSTYYSVATGDAAVAGIVSRVDEGYGYQGSSSTSYGQRHEAIIFQKRSPQLLKKTSQGKDYSQEYVTFYNEELCKEIAVHTQADIACVVDGALKKAGMNRSDIDFLITHQPVSWAVKSWRDALGVDEARSHETFEKYGNVACCCAPTNLLEAIELGKIKAKDRMVITSSGVGENHIALVDRISPTLIQSVQRGL